jgi:hypothetical protein
MEEHKRITDQRQMEPDNRKIGKWLAVNEG